MSDEELLSSIRERWMRLQDELRLDEKMRFESAPGGESQH